MVQAVIHTIVNGLVVAMPAQARTIKCISVLGGHFVRAVTWVFAQPWAHARNDHPAGDHDANPAANSAGDAA
ncbi:hypothetical protein MTO96_008389 [Rhipicephalus appendiculatus]